MNPDSLTRLETLLKTINDGLTREEFIKAFEEVMQIVVQVEQKNSAAVDKLEKTYATLFSKLNADHSQNYSDLKGQVDSLFVGDAVKKMKEENAAMLSRVEKKLASIRNGRDGKDGKDGVNGIDGIDGRDGKDGVDGKDGKVNPTPRSNNSTRFYDLSAQTNGVLKVFSVPKGLAGVVFSSDFPMVLMENRGFTINKTRTQITLTTDNAPSTGSQLLYQYVSLFN